MLAERLHLLTSFPTIIVKPKTAWAVAWSAPLGARMPAQVMAGQVMAGQWVRAATASAAVIMMGRSGMHGEVTNGSLSAYPTVRPSAIAVAA
jgi:hypothetical protein